MNTLTFGHLLGRIESQEYDPFLGKDIRVPVSDDADSGYGMQLEFWNPENKDYFFVEFDWFYSSNYRRDETGGADGWEEKEVDSIKVLYNGDELEIDEQTRERVAEYITHKVSWQQ